MSLEAAEKNAVINALEKSNNNISKASEILNVSRATLYNKLNKYNIERE
jgi:transcriptional regulator of acetoin/glycerol metabolism